MLMFPTLGSAKQGAGAQVEYCRARPPRSRTSHRSTASAPGTNGVLSIDTTASALWAHSGVPVPLLLAPNGAGAPHNGVSPSQANGLEVHVRSKVSGSSEPGSEKSTLLTTVRPV
jgi:hypothetical protein